MGVTWNRLEERDDLVSTFNQQTSKMTQQNFAAGATLANQRASINVPNPTAIHDQPLNLQYQPEAVKNYISAVQKVPYAGGNSAGQYSSLIHNVARPGDVDERVNEMLTAAAEIEFTAALNESATTPTAAEINYKLAQVDAEKVATP